MLSFHVEEFQCGIVSLSWLEFMRSTDEERAWIIRQNIYSMEFFRSQVSSSSEQIVCLRLLCSIPEHGWKYSLTSHVENRGPSSTSDEIMRSLRNMIDIIIKRWVLMMREEARRTWLTFVSCQSLAWLEHLSCIRYSSLSHFLLCRLWNSSEPSMYILLVPLFDVTFCKKSSVNQGHVDSQHDHNKQVIEESKKSEHCLRDHINGWEQIYKRHKETQGDSNAEHIHQTSQREKFACEMSHQ